MGQRLKINSMIFLGIKGRNLNWGLMPGQIGDWVKGTPSYIGPARIYMLVALMGGYIGSAVIYLLAVPAVNRDMEKRAEAVRAGGYPEVCAYCSLCTRVVAPPHII